MEEKSDQLNASQKEALLEKFKLDQVTSVIGAFDSFVDLGLDHVMQAYRFATDSLQAVLKRSRPIRSPKALPLCSIWQLNI